MIRDADRFKMDLIGGLERTLQGQVKPSPQTLSFFADTG
jgi:U3 small nucleolar RNA-associated protein 23